MIKKFVDLFIFSNIYVAIPVTCLAVVSSIVFQTPINLFLLGFIYCSTLSLYAFHRYWGLRKVTVNGRSERHEWAFQNKKILLVVVGFGLLSSGVLMFFLPIMIWIALTPLAFLSISYTLPILRKGAKRLRDIPSIKIHLISLVVGAVVVLLPALEANKTLNEIAPLFVSQCLFLFGITIPFDIRDMNVDDQELRTIPIVFGEQRAKWIAIAVLLVSSLVCLLTNLGVGFLAANLVAMLIVWFSHSKRSEYYFSLLVEGTMIIQLALVYFFR